MKLILSFDVVLDEEVIIRNFSKIKSMGGQLPDAREMLLIAHIFNNILNTKYKSFLDALYGYEFWGYLSDIFLDKVNTILEDSLPSDVDTYFTELISNPAIPIVYDYDVILRIIDGLLEHPQHKELLQLLRSNVFEVIDPYVSVLRRHLKRFLSDFRTCIERGEIIIEIPEWAMDILTMGKKVNFGKKQLFKIFGLRWEFKWRVQCENIEARYDFGGFGISVKMQKGIHKIFVDNPPLYISLYICNENRPFSECHVSSIVHMVTKALGPVRARFEDYNRIVTIVSRKRLELAYRELSGDKYIPKSVRESLCLRRVTLGMVNEKMQTDVMKRIYLSAPLAILLAIGKDMVSEYIEHFKTCVELFIDSLDSIR